MDTFIAVVGCAVGFLGYFGGLWTGQRKKGQEQGLLESELKIIKSSLVKIELEVNRINIDLVNNEISTLKENQKSLRVDLKDLTDKYNKILLDRH